MIVNIDLIASEGRDRRTYVLQVSIRSSGRDEEFGVSLTKPLLNQDEDFLAYCCNLNPRWREACRGCLFLRRCKRTYLLLLERTACSTNEFNHQNYYAYSLPEADRYALLDAMQAAGMKARIRRAFRYP